MDQTEMRAMQFREENGYLPDEVFVFTDEDDYDDPDQRETIDLVLENYAATNAARRQERAWNRIAVLEQMLRDNNLPIPD
jgi:polynucleotide 5'-kinase involved in rRNA processing